MRWDDLGWRGEKPQDGRVAFLVIAPWCEDCLEVGPEVRAQSPRGLPVYLVGEFAPETETRAFAQKFDLDWPMLFGTHEKSEKCREKARFREFRVAHRDDRHWGVPTWIEGTLRDGWFVCEKLWF